MIPEPIVMVARIRASTPQKFHAVLTRVQQETRAGNIVRFKDAKAGEWTPTHRKTLVIASSADSESDVADFIDRWGASMITGNTSKPIKETTVEKEEYADCIPAMAAEPDDDTRASQLDTLQAHLKHGLKFCTVRPSDPAKFASGLETLYHYRMTEKFKIRYVVSPNSTLDTKGRRTLMIVSPSELEDMPTCKEAGISALEALTRHENMRPLPWDDLLTLVTQTPMPDSWGAEFEGSEAWDPFLDPYTINEALDMLRGIDESDPLAGVESLENPQPAPEAEPVMHKPTAAEIKAAEVQPTWLMVEPGYEPLFAVLKAALDQAQAGKGKERHANGRAFVDQPILTLTRLYGLGYPMGQAAKKSEEALRLPKKKAQAELLGAINYLAAAYLRIGEQGDA